MTAIHTQALRAFHGDPAIKTKYLDRLAAHRLADQLTQGMTWDDETQKGCAIGCTLHQYSHAAYETELGIPRVLARLEDSIFEGLSVADSREWPTRFLEAVQPGADLSMVWPRFAHWLLADPDHGVIRHAKTEQSKKAIADVASLYFLWINGEKPSEKEWSSAAYDAAAYAASAYAAYAAYAAAYAAADAADAAAYAAAYDADAAYAAAYDADDGAAYAAAAAAYAAADAADAAAYAAAYDAADDAADDAAAYAYAAAAAAAAACAAARSKARKDARKAQSDQLVKLLSEAPVPK